MIVTASASALAAVAKCAAVSPLKLVLAGIELVKAALLPYRQSEIGGSHGSIDVSHQHQLRPIAASGVAAAGSPGNWPRPQRNCEALREMA